MLTMTWWLNQNIWKITLKCGWKIIVLYIFYYTKQKSKLSKFLKPLLEFGRFIFFAADCRFNNFVWKVRTVVICLLEIPYLLWWGWWYTIFNAFLDFYASDHESNNDLVPAFCAKKVKYCTVFLSILVKEPLHQHNTPLLTLSL
jgi:hypothetical protein